MEHHGEMLSGVRGTREVGGPGLVYAGVEFGLRAAPGSRFEWPEPCLAYLMEADHAPAVARVSCTLFYDPALGPQAGPLNPVRWSEQAGILRLRNSRVVADLRRIRAGRYRAAVRLAEGEEAAAAFLRFVAAVVVEAEGGLNLHAAALDLDGAAVAFTGPSGAGKTTACDLAPSASCLAYDQLTVVPKAGRFYAWALPHGNSSQLRRSRACVLPLAAVLRVTRGLPYTALTVADPAQALFVVRDATVTSDMSLSAEQRRLAACVALGSAVTVGHLNTVLGRPIDSLLRARLPAVVADRERGHP